MDERVMRRMKIAELLAEEDARYRSMLRGNAELEGRYNAVLSGIPTEPMDIILLMVFHLVSEADNPV